MSHNEIFLNICRIHLNYLDLRPEFRIIEVTKNKRFLVKRFLNLKSVFIGFILPLAACTRDAGDISQLKINLPSSIAKGVSSKNGALAQSTLLGHVVINVSGTNIADPIVVSWDRPENCAACAPPAAFEVEVPYGENRLIQILAVYMSQDQSMSFYYGDATKSLAAAIENVSITLAAINNSSSSLSGRVAGRYYKADGTTPTGMLAAKFTPPGKPAMIIERSPIFAGWFSTFMLEDVSLSYEADGAPLFGGSVNLQSSIFNSSSVLKVTTPDNYRVQGNQNEHGDIIVTGFFGDGIPAGKASCRPSSYTYQYRKINSGGSFLSYPGSFTLAGTSTSCSGSEFSDYIAFNPALHDNNGKDSVAGFRGPFMKVATSQMLSYDGTTLDWEYLPGIDSSIIDGVKIYARSNPVTGSSNRDYSKNGEIDCASLMQKGFLLVANVAYPQSTYVPTSISSLINPTVLICPYKGAKEYSVALETQLGGSGGGSGGPPTQLSMRRPGWPYSGIHEYTCYDYEVNLLDSSNKMTTHTAPISFTVQLGGTNATVYSNFSDCNNYANSISSTFSIPANQSGVRFWVKTPYTGPANFSIVYGGSPTLALNGLSLPVKTYSDKTLFLDGPMSLLPDVCYSYRIIYSNYAGNPYSVGSETIVNIAAANGLQAYSDSNCSSSTSTATIANATMETSIWLKIAASATVGDVTLTTTSGNPADPSTVYISKGAGTDVISQLYVSGGTSFMRDNCTGPFTVTFNNSSGTPVPLTSPGILNFNSAPMTANFFNDNSCTTNISTTVTAGNYKKQFWFKALGAGPGTISGTLNGTINGLMNVSVGGLHHLDLAITEAPPINHGTCVELSVFAENFDGSSSYFPGPATITFGGIPGGSLFASRSPTGICVDPIANYTLDAYASSGKVYLLVANTTSSTSSWTVTANESTVQSGSLSFGINAPPSLLGIDLSGTQNIPAEYNYDLNKAITLFTGVPTFSFVKNSGTGTLTGALYSSTASDTANFTISDSKVPTPASFTISTATYSKTATLNFLSSLPPGANLSRTTAANYYDAAGVLVSASSNTARFDHNPDPGSSFAPMGLLIEGASTNLVSDSENFATGAWSSGGTLAAAVPAGINSPRGDTTGVYILDDNNPEPYNVGRVFYQFTNDMTDNVDYVASVYIKKNTSRYAGMMFHENSVNSSGVLVDLDTGLTSNMAGPYTPQVYHGSGVQKLANGWYRLWVKYHSGFCTNGGSGPCQGAIAIFPAHSITGNSSGDISAAGSVYVFGAQVEQAAAMSSYIATSGAPGSRSFDDVSMSSLSSYISGFTSGPGSMRMVITQPEGNLAPSGTIFEICYSSCAEQIKISRDTGGVVKYSATAGSTPQPSLTTMQPLLKASINIVSFSWDSGSNNGLNLGLNGEPRTSANSSITLPTINNGTMKLGNNSSLNDGGVMHLQKIEYWPVKLSPSALGSL